MRNCRYLVAPFVIVVATFIPWASCLAEEEFSAEQLQFFEKKIRPVLVKHCYECHSKDSKELEAGLRLDTRAGIRQGGESGEPSIVPKDHKSGLLLNALRHEDLEMPPKEKLPDEVIADFETWIKEGAADPREGEAAKRHTIDVA